MKKRSVMEEEIEYDRISFWRAGVDEVKLG